MVLRESVYGVCKSSVVEFVKVGEHFVLEFGKRLIGQHVCSVVFTGFREFESRRLGVNLAQNCRSQDQRVVSLVCLPEVLRKYFEKLFGIDCLVSDITQQLRFAVAVEINFAFEPKVDGIVSFLELFLLKLFDFLH